MFLLKIDKFVNEDVRCFCVRDLRGKEAWIEGAGNTAFTREFKGEILQTGNFEECVAFCAGFSRAIYREAREITAISKEARSLCQEIEDGE